jgi:cation-transporting ATPase 13A2
MGSRRGTSSPPDIPLVPFFTNESTDPATLDHLQTPYKDLNIVPLQTIPYPYPLSTVFPSSSIPPATSSDTVTGHSTPRQLSISGSTSNTVSDAKDLVPSDLERGSMSWEDTMGFLKIIEYRYTKFALDERSGQWRMIR